MAKLVRLILVLILGVTALTQKQKQVFKPKQKVPDAHYCNVDESHFMCTTNGSRASDLHCKDLDMFARDEVRRDLDPFFNQLRNAYALGQLPGDSYPMSIPDMQGLVWDDELADLAERWVQQCPTKTVRHGDIERFKVAQFVTFSAGKSVPTTQDVLAKLVRDNFTFHRKGPSNGALNALYTATSQYNKTRPMTILTNPHMRYFGCSVATMKVVEEQKTSGFRQKFKRNERRLIRIQRNPPVLGTTFNPGLQPPDGINELEAPYTYLHRTVIVCNFGPLQEPYEVNPKVGEACSACAAGTMCFPGSSYPGLCMEKIAEVERVRAGIESEEDDDDGSEDDGNGCPVVCDNGVPHTLCRYKDATTAFDEVIKISGPTTSAFILAWHNLFRDGIASGNHPLDIPLASNMREMTWNENLERSAWMWAMQCLPYPDECQDERIGGANGSIMYVNQLVTRKPWNVERDGFPSFEDDILSGWAEGYKFLTPDDVTFFNSDEKHDRPYEYIAQLIWARTYMIGCGMTLCRNLYNGNVTANSSMSGQIPESARSSSGESMNKRDEGSFNFMSADGGEKHKKNDHDSYIVAVCNYAPGGSLDGDPIYSIGGPCTQCRKIDEGLAGTRGMSCSREYFHLCSAQNGSSQGLKSSDAKAYEHIKNRVRRDMDVYVGGTPKDLREPMLFHVTVTTTSGGNATTGKITRRTPSVGRMSTTTKPTTTAKRTTTTTTTTTAATTKAPTPTKLVTTHKTNMPLSTPRGLAKPRDPSCEATHKCFDELKKHTHCKYDGIAQFCKDHDLITSPLVSERFLKLHNDLRGFIAMGTVDANSPLIRFPRAGNMRKMIWDDQLATSAKEWAFQCLNGTDECRDRNYHNSCRPFLTHQNDVPHDCLLRANQLVASKEFNPANGTASPSAEEFFNEWKDQVKNFDAKFIDSYRPNEKYDSFAQLIWARTFMVGCAYVTYYKEDRAVSKIRIARLVCNYAPAGLLEARSIFKTGGACTLCEPIYKTGVEGLYCSYPLGLCDPSEASPKRTIRAEHLIALVILTLINSVFSFYG